MLDLTTCPDCGTAAHVEWRAVLESTDGPVEHAKVRCERRHWFLLPVADLPKAREVSDSSRVPTRSTSDVRS